MAEIVPTPPDAPVPRHRLASDVVLHWRGLLAFSLLGAVGVMGPDLTPSQYFDIYHYIPRYVLLALSIRFRAERGSIWPPDGPPARYRCAGGRRVLVGDHHYFLLALSIGFGLSAVRSGRRVDRLREWQV